MIEQMKLKSSECVLVVVDVQERLARVMERHAQVEAAIGMLIRCAKLHEIPIVFTQQYTKGLGPTVEAIAVQLEGIEHVEKVSFSCCGEEPFNRTLDSLGRRKVILTGMETHVCVLQTAVDLIDAGYTVHVPWDAVCSRSDGNRDAGLHFMERAGAVMTSSETVAFQILGRAGTPQFKEISSLLK
jgi:nicotinamidase-related amidase